MRIRFAIVLFLLACLRQPVTAQTIEIPLPDLAGEFKGGGFVHSTVVHLDSPPDSVRHVWMRLRGEVTPGLVECMIYPDGPWPADFTVETWDTIGRAWWYAGAGVPDPGQIGVQEPFDVTVEFRPMAGATWETLMSGQFTVYLEEHPSGLVGVCTGQARPFGTVVDVRMIIEGDFPADVLPSTWGQVKSLWSN